MPVCACVGASIGPGRAGERLAKPRSSTPRRPWPVGCCGQGLTGRAGAAGVRLRGQRLADCTGAGEEVPAPPGKPRCPATQPTVPNPRRARRPRLLAPLRRGARGGDGGTGADGPPAGVSSFRGTGCPRHRVCPHPPAEPGMLPPLRPTVHAGPGCCPQAGRCRAPVQARPGAPRTAMAVPSPPRGICSLAAEGSSHPVRLLLGSRLWLIASEG